MVILAALAAVSACNTAPDEPVTTAQAAAPVCGNAGRVVGELYGEIRVSLDWDSYEVTCEGMPRPEGSGTRLRFAGQIQPGDRQIAVIIAMPDFTRATTTAELPANVTLIEEGNGRFFSTPTLDNCLSDIRSVDALDDSGDRFAVSGALYCVSPLPQVNGDSSISIPELAFTGLLDWSAS